MAIQRVCLTIGSGSMETGFEVTVRVGQLGEMPTTEIQGKLPSGSRFLSAYSTWKTCQHPWQEKASQRGITLHVTQRTHVSYSDAYHGVETQFNQWLQSPDRDWQKIRDRLQQLLDPNDEIQVILQTDHPQLRQFPWSAWHLFIQDYPNAEIALASSEYQRVQSILPQSDRIRVLLVLGHGELLNLEEDVQILKQLESYGADAPTVLHQPTPTLLRETLRDPKGWHIFCYSGHSHSREDGTLGSLQLQANQSMSLEDLKLSLQKAIAQGLQLAIFNSCDGLGLARQLAALNLPQSIVMREQIPDAIAPQFLETFLLSYAQGQGLYLALRDARERLREEWHIAHPGVDWLPVLSQNPAIISPTWQDLGGGRQPSPLCPYVGLAAFQETDADRFFGREGMIEQVLETLDRQMLMTLYGASGCGKSSLVLAGVLPRYRAQYGHQLRDATLKPGAFPCEALARAMIEVCSPPELGDSEEEIAYEVVKTGLQLEKDSDTLTHWLESASQKHPQQRFLLILDQLEELFTLGMDGAVQTAFLENVSQALQSVSRLRVLVTVRPEFLPDLQQHPGWNQLLQACQPILLGPMTSLELERAIAQPALQLGVSFEAGLVQRLQREMRGEPQRLPLLEFALTQLWEKMTAEQQLTHEAFQSIGSLDQALANYAEACFTQLEGGDRTAAEQILPQLVIPGEDHPTTRRRLAWTDIPEPYRDVITHLASQRLLVTSHKRSGERGSVELIHEALIDHWPLFQVWISRDREFLLWQEQVRAQYRLWQKTAEHPDAFLTGTLLHQSEHWFAEKSAVLSDVDQQFIQLSLAERDRQTKEKATIQRKQKRLRWIAGLTGISAVMIGGIALWQWQQNSEQQLIQQALDGTLSPAKQARLAQILEHRLKQLQATPSTSKNLETQLTQFRQIGQLSQTVQAQIRSSPSPLGDRYAYMEHTSSQQLLNLLKQYRFPILQKQLQQRQWGKVIDATPDQLANQFSPGAMQTTYQVLFRPFGFHADRNDDGLIDQPQEAQWIPCEAIALIEKLWRDHTQQRCGWYGSESEFENPACHELQFLTEDIQLDETTGEMKTLATKQGGTLLQTLVPFPPDAMLAHISACRGIAFSTHKETPYAPHL